MNLDTFSAKEKHVTNEKKKRKEKHEAKMNKQQHQNERTNSTVCAVEQKIDRKEKTTRKIA